MRRSVSCGNLSKWAAKLLEGRADELPREERESDAYQIVVVRPGDEYTCNILHWNEYAAEAAMWGLAFVPGMQEGAMLFGMMYFAMKATRFMAGCE